MDQVFSTLLELRTQDACTPTCHPAAGSCWYEWYACQYVHLTESGITFDHILTHLRADSKKVVRPLLSYILAPVQ
jgi:hypothetical protein